MTALNLPPAVLPFCRAGLLLAALSLAGCGLGSRLPTVTYIAAGANTDQRLDAEMREDYRQHLGLLQDAFRQLYPGTTFQLGLYPEDQIIPAIVRRSNAGLDPDLLYINGDTALQLLQAGLVAPFPTDPGLEKLFHPETLARLRNADGQLAGLPVLVQTQLSCFDRRQLPEAPRTLEELLQISAAGKAIGLTVDPVNLLWTAGSLGTLPALQRTLRGQPLSPADRQAIQRWLSWLQAANVQQRVTFFASQLEADAEFLGGGLAWIPCRSTALPMLRRRLGARLGVAPLPDGPNHPASAVNRLRVMALGRHSSEVGRQRAIAFSRFNVNPLTQRTLTMGSQTVLPANRFVSVPVQSSQVLETLNTAAAQGLEANELVASMHSNDTRMPELKALITRVVFNETSAAAGSDRLVQILRKTR